MQISTGGRMSNSFLFAVVIVIATAIIIRHGNTFRDWVEKLIFDPLPPVVTEPGAMKVDPEPVVELQTPSNYGNIKLLSGEEDDVELFGPEVHDFPDMKAPLTRFEDFNRRLFIVELAKEMNGAWPETTSDDFATRIKGMTFTDLKEQIRLRLRPRYPVIYDAYGHWAWVSGRLEQDPDYTDEITEAYLALPESVRPVVVSQSTGSKTGFFIFIRYGFQDYYLNLASMRFHLGACLTLVLEALTGPRDHWLWFSVARMRQTAIRAHQQLEAQRTASKLALFLEEETAQAKRETEHQNRFVALFRSRLDFTNLPAALGSDAPSSTDTQPGQGGAS